jgi:hypothetical protein
MDRSQFAMTMSESAGVSLERVARQILPVQDFEEVDVELYKLNVYGR